MNLTLFRTIIILMPGVSALGQESFHPTQPNPFEESWRWHEVKEVQGYRAHAMAEDMSVWFATDRELLRYDGYTWSEIPVDPDINLATVTQLHFWQGRNLVILTPNRISMLIDGEWITRDEYRSVPNAVALMEEDRWGNLWVVTVEGILRFTPSGEITQHLPAFSVNALHIDPDDMLWFGTRSGHVRRVPISEEGITPSVPVESYPVFNNVRGNFMSFSSAPDGEIWAVAATVGEPVMVYNREDDEWRRIAVPGNQERRRTFSVLWDSAGRLWITMSSQVLCLEGGSWKVFTTEDHPIPFRWLSFNETRDGRLWLAERGSVPYSIEANTGRWRSFENLAFKTEDFEGNQWFVTLDRRIARFDPRIKQWTLFGQRDGVPQVPVMLKVDHEGRIWAFGSDTGVAAVALLKDEQWHITRFPDFGSGIGRETVNILSDGRICFGTFLDFGARAEFRGGLVVFGYSDQSGVQVERFYPPDVPERTTSIVESSEGGLWLVGPRVRYFDWETTWPVVNYPWTESLPSPTVRVVADEDRNIWISHWGRGVARFDGSDWTTFTHDDGLVSNLVARIYASPDNTVWAGTPHGYSRFHEGDWITLALPEHLTAIRGPNELQFSRDGSVWANRVQRFWYHDPDYDWELGDHGSGMKTIHYRHSDEPPRTFLNPLPRTVSKEGFLAVSWHGRRFHLFDHEGALSYSYRINDNEWSPYENKREIILENLPKGTHTFEVRARDRSLNVDPHPARATFEVAGVIWLEPWFLALVGGLLSLIFALGYLSLQMRFRHLMHLEELKVQFFTNISHELRTPLSVIIGPLQTLREKVIAPGSRQLLDMAIRNANHMLGLIDEILEFRRAQSIRVTQQMVRIEVGAFFNDAIDELKFLAQQRNHKLMVNLPSEPVWIRTDQSKLLKVFDNLLTNAIKYTPNGGDIWITVKMDIKEDDSILRFSVEDTGIGIPKTRRKEIFIPFFRVNEGERIAARGTGIGLALVKEYVEAMDGIITIQSPYPRGSEMVAGTSFAVEVKVEQSSAPVEHDTPVQSSDEKPDIPALVTEIQSECSGVDPEASTESGVATTVVPRILVIEDNADIRDYLRGELEPEFEIIEADNGSDGATAAESEMPDLILADVMMPGMDGFQLTRQLKENLLTSHIPVILVTARRSFDAELTGLETGADDYVTKPFNILLLKQKIRNFLDHRRAMRARFSKQIFLGPSEISVTPADEKFLKRAMQVIEEHIADYEFNVDEFSRRLGLSRTSLYRKFKAISGEAPTMFLRNIRMERAAQYLRSRQFNVSEVVGKVGFLDHSYFCACFKKKFGCTPSEYSAKETAASS